MFFACRSEKSPDNPPFYYLHACRGFTFLCEIMLSCFDLKAFLLRTLSCRRGRSRPAWRRCCWIPEPWRSAPAVCPRSAGTTPASTPTQRLGSASPETGTMSMICWHFIKTLFGLLFLSKMLLIQQSNDSILVYLLRNHQYKLL